MVSEDHSNLVDKLRLGELDAIVTNQTVCGTDLKVLASVSMPVAAVVASSLAKIKRVSPRLQLESFIKETSCGFVLPTDKLQIRIETDLYFQSSKIKGDILFESDILAAVVRAAHEGIGIGFLPKPYIRNELREKTLFIVGESNCLWQHHIYLVSTRPSVNIPVIDKLRTFFISLDSKLTT